jgi:hypothetical protein
MNAMEFLTTACGEEAKTAATAMEEEFVRLLKERNERIMELKGRQRGFWYNLFLTIRKIARIPDDSENWS